MEKTMKFEKRQRLIKLVAFLALFGHSAASLAASGSFEKNIAIDGVAIIDVSNQSGTVVVRGGDVDQVTIRARILVDERYSKTNPLKVGEIISAIKRSPPVELDGNRVIIETLTKHTHKRYVSISYEILVPREAEINVHSVSGNVRVSGIIGEVNATSDTGKVTVAKLDEANAARSSS
jgi:hypothetical protein